RKVAISTGTKNLQEQLFFKDVPFVQNKIFPNLDVALLKGRNNFVCHARMKRFLRQPSLPGMVEPESLDRIVEWYNHTRRHGAGDRAEIEYLADDDPIWLEIASTSETCRGWKCAHREECFILRMRARASQADMMIVNHHLLISDLGVKDAGFGEVIPRYESLIVDEAHGLEDAATSHFGFHVSQPRLLRLLRDAAEELTSPGKGFRGFPELLTNLDRDVRALFKAFPGFSSSREKLGLPDEYQAKLRDLVCTELDTLAAKIGSMTGATEELHAIEKRAREISLELGIILGAQQSGDYACWVEYRDGAPVLHASPVEVGGILDQRLYAAVRSIVFTSATLSSGGTFDYFKSRLGLDKEKPTQETILDSPFDYATQTMLYVPRSIPEPNSPQFTNAVAPVLQEVFRYTRGRAFVLFTSYRNMQEVFAQMQGKVPFPLLIQGSRPKTRLLEEFRERPGSVLFATASFWEGVDVQGEALSCVIVDRLPFAPPDEPVVSARIERIRSQGGDPFRSFQVPMAIIALKQGLGRLIRTRTDFGVLCILDTRILTKWYGKTFLKSLHTGPLTRDPGEIKAFFGRN
ncbi:MAG: ATP-dependent DNA helicase, partial [Desulfomonile sp.]|nr:ATP-dependent DNA helicase [Desulfomonile sp.]